MHDDFGRHHRVNGAVVGVAARRGEAEAELLIGVERLRGERTALARDGVRDVVVIDPGDLAATGDQQLARREGEVVDGDRRRVDVLRVHHLHRRGQGFFFQLKILLCVFDRQCHLCLHQTMFDNYR